MDVVQVLVFHLPAVRRRRPVYQPLHLAIRNRAGIVVPPRDGAARLRDRQLQLVLAEFGPAHHVFEDAEHGVGVFLECRKAHAAAGFIHSGLDRRGHVFQFLVDLVAGFRFRPTGAQHLRRELGKPFLVRRIEQIPRANESQSMHQRQFVILQQKHAHAICERKRRWLRNFHLRQWRIFQVFVRRNHLREQAAREANCQNQALHFEPPSAGACVYATVRPFSTRYVFATRRTSSAVTLSYSCNCVNSFFQSPKLTE